jgi:hypothetical protein
MLSGNDQAESSAASTTSDSEAPSPIESLKQALTTLTVENKKKEMAFQSG